MGAIPQAGSFHLKAHRFLPALQNLQDKQCHGQTTPQGLSKTALVNNILNISVSVEFPQTRVKLIHGTSATISAEHDLFALYSSDDECKQINNS